MVSVTFCETIFDCHSTLQAQRRRSVQARLGSHGQGLQTLEHCRVRLVCRL